MPVTIEGTEPLIPYIICFGSDPGDLQQQVNVYLNKGYIPYGEMIIDPTTAVAASKKHYFQTMVHRSVFAPTQ